MSQTIKPFGSPTPTLPVAGGEAEASDHPFSTLSPLTTITTDDQANVAASPIRVQVEGQEESRLPPVAGGEAETSDRPSSTRSVSTPSTTATPELVIEMTLPDEESEIVDMVSPTPPQQVALDSSRPPPVADGAAESKASESPPTTITTPELELPPARTSPLPSASMAPPDETVPSCQDSNLDVFKDDDIDLENLMVASFLHF